MVRRVSLHPLQPVPRLKPIPPEVIVSSSAHLPSASSEPQGGLGWFHGAAMHCPSPSWAEGKEREMGMWWNHIMLSAFHPAGKPPGKLRREQGARTSWQEASGWVLAIRTAERVSGQGGDWWEQQERWKACQNWLHRITLFQLPGPEGQSKTQRSHSAFLPSVSRTFPGHPGPCLQLAASPEAHLLLSPSCKTHWGGSLVLKTERNVLMRHCSVGNCFLSFPHSWESQGQLLAGGSLLQAST